MVGEGEDFPRGVPPHARAADPGRPAARPATPRLPGKPEAKHPHAGAETLTGGRRRQRRGGMGPAVLGRHRARTLGRVYRLAYRLTGNAHDAEDLTQDVFIRVFRSLDSYSPGTFEGWLHRITTNLFLDRMRRKARIRFDALPEDAERVVGSERSPEAMYADRHLDADVEAALNALPADFRVAVVLCDIEQLSYEEIADVLHVKLGTVRSRISRGRTMLRRSLSARAPGPDPGGAPA